MRPSGNRESHLPRDTPSWVSERKLFVLSLVAGVAGSAAYYALRRAAWTGLIWPLPEPAPGPLVFAIAPVIPLVLYFVRPFRIAPASDSPAKTGLVAFFSIIPLLFIVRPAGVSGDGQFWIEHAHDPFLMSSEPLGHWMHVLTFRLLAAFSPASGESAIRWSSIAAGIFFLAGLTALAPGAFRRIHPAVSIPLLFFAPVCVLFFGYPETTPWAYAFYGTYLLSGLRYIRSRPARAPWIESILLALALWTHGMVCFGTGAHAALIAIWILGRPQSEATSSPRSKSGLASATATSTALALALLPFLPLAASILYAKVHGSGLAGIDPLANCLGGADRIRWIAFSYPRTVHQYVFLSTAYWMDIANLVFAACPVLPISILAAITLIRRKSPEGIFLAAGLAGLVLFSMTWNADLSMRGDFDLMAMFALPAYALLALAWEEWLPARKQRILAAALISAALGFSILPSIRLS